MPETVRSLFPTAKELLEVEPKTLAPILLRLARDHRQGALAMFLPGSVMQDTAHLLSGDPENSYPYHQKAAVEALVNEAWNLLRMDGFVASAAGINGHNGWLVLTGAGEQVSASTEAHGRVRALKAFPKSLLHPVTDEKTGSELVARHAELIGRVTLMWNDVHAQAGQLFQDFCASAEARKRYSETQNDRIQRQLLLSVGSVALEKYPDLRERLEKTLTELDLLAGDRNAAIHTYWAVDLPTGKILAHRRSPPHKRLRADFEEQFEGLLEKLSDLWLSLFDLRIDYFDRNARRDQSS